MAKEASSEQRKERLDVLSEIIVRSHYRMKHEMETYFSDMTALTIMIQREYHDDYADRIDRRMEKVDQNCKIRHVFA